jgi:hypothetical protein
MIARTAVIHHLSQQRPAHNFEGVFPYSWLRTNKYLDQQTANLVRHRDLICTGNIFSVNSGGNLCTLDVSTTIQQTRSEVAQGESGH